MGVGGQHHAPAAFTPGMTRFPLYRKEAVWASEPVWIGAENLTSTGIRSPDFPSRSESLYTDYAMPAPHHNHQHALKDFRLLPVWV
jgi:hypothetical protein